jgi:hypothetical protein
MRRGSIPVKRLPSFGYGRLQSLLNVHRLLDGALY